MRSAFKRVKNALVNLVISTSNPQPNGTASAGSSGQVSDAGHVHQAALITSFQYNTHGGYGSTNLSIPYYTTLVEGASSDLVTVENSASLGFSITALKRCKLTIDWTHGYATQNWFGVSKNSSQLSTNVASMAVSDRLNIAITPNSNQSGHISWSGILEIGDVIRPHTSASAFSSILDTAHMTGIAEEITS